MTATAPSSQATKSPPALDAASADRLIDAGLAPRPDAAIAEPAVTVKPAVVLPVLTAKSTRLSIAGLSAKELVAARGQFRATGSGFRVDGSWRRSDGGLAVSVRATPWAIVYRKQGPALGRTPPMRHLRLNPGGRETLRFKHPELGEFKLQLGFRVP